jgi:hypothetical protein
VSTVALALGKLARRNSPPSRPGDRRELAHGLVQTGDRGVGMRDQDPARVGELRSLSGAVEQLHADLALERRDLLADRRLRQIEAVGGG